MGCLYNINVKIILVIIGAGCIERLLCAGQCAQIHYHIKSSITLVSGCPDGTALRY